MLHFKTRRSMDMKREKKEQNSFHATTSRDSYLFAGPSIFPPSPMVTYTGADPSATGSHFPFTKLDTTFETLCYKMASIYISITDYFFNWSCFLRHKRGSTYTTFIAMDMAWENHIDFVLHKPSLEHHSHRFPFHKVIVVAVVPRRVH